jgi:hypothetical protein
MSSVGVHSGQSNNNHRDNHGAPTVTATPVGQRHDDKTPYATATPVALAHPVH